MWHLSSAYMYGQAGVLAYTGVITKVSCIDRFSVPKAIGLRCYSQIFTWDTLNYFFSRLLCSNLKSRPILHISKRNYKKTEPDYYIEMAKIVAPFQLLGAMGAGVVLKLSSTKWIASTKIIACKVTSVVCRKSDVTKLATAGVSSA